MKTNELKIFKPTSIFNVFDDLMNLDSLNRNWLFRNPLINESYNSIGSTNIIENDDKYKIEILTPSFSKDDISINIENNMLIISGENSFKKEDNKKYHLVEFEKSSFKRSFELPNNIDKDSIKASFNDGILNISINKIVKEKTIKTINID